MSNKIKRDSPLVKSVLALDNYLSELERIGSKINSTDMTSDFDVEHIHKLMARFAECGQGVADEVTTLSSQLRDAQARAEVVAEGVSRQADLLNVRSKELNAKLEEFRILGEKVRDLNTQISHVRRPREDGQKEAQREELASNIPAFEAQLTTLIDELVNLQTSARNSRMKALEKNTESLVQSLQAMRKKLRDFGEKLPS